MVSSGSIKQFTVWKYIYISDLEEENINIKIDLGWISLLKI